MKAVLAAAPLLYLIDAFGLGQGFLSLVAAAVALVVLGPMCAASLLRDRQSLPLRAGALAAFLVVPGAVRATNRWNESVARGRAEALIKASEDFRLRHGRFPEDLDELVPAFIPKILPARIGVIGSRFEYLPTDSGHRLQWMSLPPYGRTYYLMEEKRWGRSEL